MKINELIEKAHGQAVLSGWYEDKRTPLEVYALIHSEVSEAVEQVRNGKEPIYFLNGKPEGELIEIADIIIRCLDWCGYNKWDLENAIKIKMDYNATRPKKHGKLL